MGGTASPKLFVGKAAVYATIHTWTAAAAPPALAELTLATKAGPSGLMPSAATMPSNPAPRAFTSPAMGLGNDAQVVHTS